tara:strand:+ start:6428 stop:6544 length:117 start_codon:yes stop_codon:yes gene_type:complete
MFLDQIAVFAVYFDTGYVRHIKLKFQTRKNQPKLVFSR